MKDVFGTPISLPSSVSPLRPIRRGDVLTTRSGTLVVASGVFETWVSAMVLTAPHPHASFPSFLASPAGMSKVVVWPESEFGLCTSRIDAKVSRICDFNSRGTGCTPLPAMSVRGAMDALEQVIRAAWETAGDTYPFVS